MSSARSIPDGIDLPLFAALRRGVVVVGIRVGAGGVQRGGIRGRFGQFEDELEFFLAAFPVGDAVVLIVLVGIVRVGVAASRSTQRGVGGGGVGRGSPVIGVGMRGRGGIIILAVLLVVLLELLLLLLLFSDIPFLKI